MDKNTKNEAFKFLSGKVFYVATLENNKPKLRPFKSICDFEDKLYFEVGNFKNVYKQLVANPYVSISACSENYDWIRIEGEAVFDNRIVVKQKLLEDNPNLIKHGIYTCANDKTLEVFFIDKAEVNFYPTGGPYNYGNFKPFGCKI